MGAETATGLEQPLVACAEETVPKGVELFGETFFADADNIFDPNNGLAGRHVEAYYKSESFVTVSVIKSRKPTLGNCPPRGTVSPVTDVKVATHGPYKSEYNKRVWMRTNHFPLPFYEARARRRIRQAQKLAGSLAMSEAKTA